MNDLFNVLISTVKAKITPLWTKLKYWTSWSYIRSRVLTKIRQLLSSLFSIKPRNRHDYFPVLGFLVSKKLAFSVVIIVGLLCLYYLFFVNPPFRLASGMEDGLRVYNYNSVPLRFANDQVRIRARSGYVAYEGSVEKGYASGYGTLYSGEGQTVYEGQFAQSKYEGAGTLYYPSGQMQYKGAFSENLFEGEGTLYRENGTKQYKGEFLNGEEEGQGTLYDGAENEIFTGSFHLGDIVYSQLLGLGADEISSIYTGGRTLYQFEDETAVLLEDIGAYYVSGTGGDSIEDTLAAEEVYVCGDTFRYGDRVIDTVNGLTEVLGTPSFEGNSYLTFPEAVGISWLQEQGKRLETEAGLSAQAPYKEVREVDGFNESGLLYLYVYQKDDLTYTFFCEDKDGGFFLYLLE
ncbi:MAG: hypothetical protein Q4C65_06805 [Eubacteriales bacterium]|nr:hypothetical protein [Eubacteriales bacterium]